MKLNFITISGKCFTVDVDSQQTVAQVKEKIAGENELVAKNLEFFLNSVRLQNENVIKDLNIIPDSQILLHNTNQYVDRHVTGTLFTPSENVKQSFRKPEDPPDFDSQILLLMELGFDAEQCAQAIRNSHYDINVAGELLTNH